MNELVSKIFNRFLPSRAGFPRASLRDPRDLAARGQQRRRPWSGLPRSVDIAKHVFQLHKADGAGYVRFRKRLTPNGSANRSLQLGWNLQQFLRQSGSSSTGRPQCAPASGGVPVLSGHGHAFSPSLHDLAPKIEIASASSTSQFLMSSHRGSVIAVTVVADLRYGS